MIKINLLEETRQQVKARSGGGAGLPRFQVAGNFGPILLLSGVGAAIAAIALWFFAVQSELGKLDEAITKAQAERARLEYVIKRHEELQRMKDDLNRKIGIIAELKRKQALPVQLMDLISRNLADFVWLEQLTYTGELVTIKGKAMTPIALANFLRSLENSPHFAEVALGKQSNDPVTGTSFDLTVAFRPAGSQPVPAAGAGAAAPGPA